MGGDRGLSVTVPAAVTYLASHPDVLLILVGPKEGIESELATHSLPSGARLKIHHATEVVSMDESPSSALRSKKDSSMRVAINLIKNGDADACVSAGNTGALMAIARYVLKTMPGIERPAIVSMLPSIKGHTYVLDLGANVDCNATHLFQFAVMASTLVTSIEHKDRPSVGLLNVGQEEIKGNDIVKQAGELLRRSELNYYGNVEGDDIYKGTTDIVVCDGFVGNIALKASEGLLQMLATYLREEFTRNLYTKAMATLARPVINSFKRRVDHRRYNGASLLGLKGIVVKSHGSADAFAFEFAIDQAVEEVKSRVLEKIEERMTLSQQGVA